MARRYIFEAGEFFTGFQTCDDFLEIVTGHADHISKEYMEASEDVKKVGNKSMSSLKRFLVAIEDIDQDKKVQDPRISASKGNIKEFKGYHNIEVCMDFMEKNLKGLPLAPELKKLHDALVKFQPQYTEAYDKKVRLLVLEYESALYLLVTGITMTLCTNMEVVQNGNDIKFQKKEGSTGGVTAKTLKDMVKQLTAPNHKDYLDVMLKSVDYKPVSAKVEAAEFVYLEAGVADTVELIDTVLSNIGKIGRYTKNIVGSIVRSVFGIIPLIRSVLYLRYKKKADTVIALEQQAEFLEQNIETLKNKQTDQPNKKAAVIKRQQAIVDSYKRRAEKLRAELTEGERDASAGIQDMNQEIHDKKDDDSDFVLESGGFVDTYGGTLVSESVDYVYEVAISDRDVKSETPGTTRANVFKKAYKFNRPITKSEFREFLRSKNIMSEYDKVKIGSDGDSDNTSKDQWAFTKWLDKNEKSNSNDPELDESSSNSRTIEARGIRRNTYSFKNKISRKEFEAWLQRHQDDCRGGIKKGFNIRGKDDVWILEVPLKHDSAKTESVETKSKAGTLYHLESVLTMLKEG